MPAFFLGEHHEGQETNDQLLFPPRSTESGTLFAQTMAFQNACCRVRTKAQPNKNCSGARGCATRVCFSACAPKDSGSSFLILYDIDDPWMAWMVMGTSLHSAVVRMCVHA